MAAPIANLLYRYRTIAFLGLVAAPILDRIGKRRCIWVDASGNTLSVVPLFILMGNLVTRAGMSQELFRAANTCIGHLRGGLAMAWSGP
jgi:TRAP-type mannitol/chloroaromatic compound transport system permease large subunit